MRPLRTCVPEKASGVSMNSEIPSIAGSSSTFRQIADHVHVAFHGVFPHWKGYHSFRFHRRTFRTLPPGPEGLRGPPEAGKISARIESVEETAMTGSIVCSACPGLFSLDRQPQQDGFPHRITVRRCRRSRSCAKWPVIAATIVLSDQ
jgi:hypothetical protein